MARHSDPVPVVDTGALRFAPGTLLASIDTASTPGFEGSRKEGEHALASGAAALGEVQERLFASSTVDGTSSVLLVLQAMDTAGKGGIVKHVVGAVDPQGVQYHAFKKPSEEELAHDFLWRVRRELPKAGQIGVFDRSHYEDVLIARVHSFAAPEVIEERYLQINAFEQELADAGTTVIKVMLHLGKDEQKRRLAARLDRPDKHWKYNPGDVDERLLWDDYQSAYQAALDRTSTGSAPWHVVPADKKWYARVAVQRLLLEATAALDVHWPAADYDVEVEKARLAAS